MKTKNSMHYHLVGIGGIGMSGIAHLLLSCGKAVSGSDLKESKIVRDLRTLGARIFLGHAASNVQEADVVIYSSAVKEDNPEIIEAKRKGLTIIKRAQALAELMQEKTVIAVTGSHGKTTTTSLSALLLLEAGLSPTAAVGGILKNINSNACLGKGKFFVAEADESDGSFLYYQPKYSIITNIDREHLDYYKDFANALAAYRQFLERTQPDGCVFACADDVHLQKIMKDYKNRRVFFGLNQNADIYPENIAEKGLSSEFDCFYQRKFVSHFSLSLGGRHNISNALAVIALGMELKIDLKVIQKILADYQGAKRRLEVKFRDERYLLIDDYAHHPTEIKATLAAVQNLKYNRLIAVFQPHRYSRTQILADDFARSFDFVDKLVLTEIYPAGEPALAGISSGLLCQKIKDYAPEKAVECLKKEEIVRHILDEIKPGDLVITLGAGDITKINDELAEALKGKN